MTTADRFFIYVYCDDLAAMRRFYRDLLGLDEVFYSEGPDGGFAAHHGSVQFTVFRSTDAVPTPSDWHRQPGWEGGTLPDTSWSIQLADETVFTAAVKRLGNSGVPRRDDVPQWRGYWSFPVKDPMGNTVEVTHAPEREPASTSWPG